MRRAQESRVGFDMENIGICDECGSRFLKSASKMASLCPECASLLYGYDNCAHVFEDGICAKCLWDGSRSDYTEKIHKENER